MKNIYNKFDKSVWEDSVKLPNHLFVYIMFISVASTFLGCDINHQDVILGQLLTISHYDTQDAKVVTLDQNSTISRSTLTDNHLIKVTTSDKIFMIQARNDQGEIMEVEAPLHAVINILPDVDILAFEDPTIPWAFDEVVFYVYLDKSSGEAHWMNSHSYPANPGMVNSSNFGSTFQADELGNIYYVADETFNFLDPPGFHKYEYNLLKYDPNTQQETVHYRPRLDNEPAYWFQLIRSFEIVSNTRFLALANNDPNFRIVDNQSVVSISGVLLYWHVEEKIYIVKHNQEETIYEVVVSNDTYELVPHLVDQRLAENLLLPNPETEGMSTTPYLNHSIVEDDGTVCLFAGNGIWITNSGTYSVGMIEDIQSVLNGRNVYFPGLRTTYLPSVLNGNDLIFTTVKDNEYTIVKYNLLSKSTTIYTDTLFSSIEGFKVAGSGEVFCAGILLENQQQVIAKVGASIDIID
jgi:hypothetical protein